VKIVSGGALALLATAPATNKTYVNQKRAGRLSIHRLSRYKAFQKKFLVPSCFHQNPSGAAN
jgi:hypothetical protein